MKKTILKIVSVAGIFALSAGLLMGCGQSSSSSSSTSDTSGNVKGSITLTGSTALQPLAQEIAPKFQDKYPDATANVQGGGSGTGLNDVAGGKSDIGNSDVFAEEKLPAEQAAALVDHKVCVVGFAAVVNANITVDNLTQQQLIDIFTGKVTNWKDVGGSNKKIVILSRPASSGTKATFKKYALNGKDEAQGQSLTEDSSGTVAKTVKSTDGSISYLATSFLNNDENKKGLKVLKFNGTEMTSDNIISGKYPIWSYEHMYTKGEAKGVAKAFIDYITSSEMKATIKKMGYIPISDMKTSREK